MYLFIIYLLSVPHWEVTTVLFHGKPNLQITYTFSYLDSNREPKHTGDSHLLYSKYIKHKSLKWRYLYPVNSDPCTKLSMEAWIWELGSELALPAFSLTLVVLSSLLTIEVREMNAFLISWPLTSFI